MGVAQWLVGRTCNQWIACHKCAQTHGLVVSLGFLSTGWLREQTRG